MKKNICVYTCITGEYDNLKEIENLEKEIDYYCFTNNKNIVSKTWKVVYIEDNKLSNVQLARKIKILGHSIINNNYEVLLWMDGAVVFKKNIMDFIKYYLTDEDNFVAFEHGNRNNIKDECNACVRLKKETKENVYKILNFYRQENYPDDNGLIESTVFIKRMNNDLVDATMRLWFDMILDYSHRDQLSFNYCIYKTGLKVKWIKEKVFNNDWFGWENHKFENKIETYRVYFGDESNYCLENDIQGVYEIKDSKFIIILEVPNTVDSLILEFSKVPCTILNGIKLNKKQVRNIIYYNCVEYNGKKVFYNHNCILKINKDFDVNERLEIELDLHIMNTEQIFDFINEIGNRTVELSELKQQNKKLEEEKTTIINSKGWIFLEKMRKIKRRLIGDK